jgi:hypothetical protein
MIRNDDPFMPWNDPTKDDAFAPHNGIDSDNPFKPWNDPFGKISDLSDSERRAYGIRPKYTEEHYYNGDGDEI